MVGRARSASKVSENPSYKPPTKISIYLEMEKETADERVFAALRFQQVAIEYALLYPTIK
jgi:hypothetical protein